MADLGLAEWRAAQPAIAWEKPAMIEIMGVGAPPLFACRVCIANVGFNAAEWADCPFAFLTEDEAVEHIREVHGG
jgi:hypothetical protein